MFSADRKVYIGKNCAQLVLSMVLDPGLKTQGAAFPNTDRPRPVTTFVLDFN